MNYLTYTRHYSVSRSVISERIFNYLKREYPQYPGDSYFEFVNDIDDFGPDWGGSKQIAHSISVADMLRVIYNRHGLEVFYEDFPDDSRPVGLRKVPLSSKLFLSENYE